jgi:hypothetical protein
MCILCGPSTQLDNKSFIYVLHVSASRAIIRSYMKTNCDVHAVGQQSTGETLVDDRC